MGLKSGPQKIPMVVASFITKSTIQNYEKLIYHFMEQSFYYSLNKFISDFYYLHFNLIIKLFTEIQFVTEKNKYLGPKNMLFPQSFIVFFCSN